MNVIIKEKGYNIYHEVELEVFTKQNGNKIAIVKSDVPATRNDWKNATKRYSMRWIAKEGYISSIGNSGLFDVLEGKENIIKYQGRVVTDAWPDEDGNWIENDGYNVNEICIPESWSKKKIAVYLYNLGHIFTTDLRVIDVTDYGNHIEITLKKNKYPLFYMWCD